jgi:hypothetical protein
LDVGGCDYASPSVRSEWTLPRLAEKNSLMWMAEVSRLLVDLRDMPREVQDIAFKNGLIPYIPADRKEQS